MLRWVWTEQVWNLEIFFHGLIWVDVGNLACLLRTGDGVVSWALLPMTQKARLS